MSEDLRIGFIGNPNCGKTTLSVTVVEFYIVYHTV